VPTLRLRRALAKAELEQIVRLMADDPMARIDVPHFAAQNQCRIVAVTDQGELMTFDVVKSR
jgi:tRNA 2-thiouridine synthesizing protein A